MTYINGVFEWDREKSEANWRDRGFDFAHAALIFDGPTLERDDERFDYGERRVQAIGRIEENILVVVYTWRGIVRRVISARMANRRERDAFRKVFG